MLDKFFEALYLKVFVNIIVNSDSSDVYIEMCSKKAIVEHAQKSFDTTELSDKMINFISQYTKETPYYYISILDTFSEQGAIPTCEKNRLDMYTDISDCEHKCQDSKWTYYTSKSDLYDIEKQYKDIGMDFIFSPFSILFNFFKDKIDDNLAIYVLVRDSFVSLSIFENSELLYAKHLCFDKDNEELVMSEEVQGDEMLSYSDDSIDLDDLDAVEEMEDLEDFGDIEDLESIEEIDEFSHSEEEENIEDIEEEVLDDNDENTFNEDYETFSFIQSSLNDFYKDEKYESKFIENVYVADSIGLSSDLKKYLEEEMFLNVYIRKMDLMKELLKLSKMEIGL